MHQYVPLQQALLWLVLILSICFLLWVLPPLSSWSEAGERGFEATFHLLESDSALHMTETMEEVLGPKSKIDSCRVSELGFSYQRLLQVWEACFCFDLLLRQNLQPHFCYI